MEVPWLCLGSLVCDFKSGVLQTSDRKEQFTGLAVKSVLLLTDYSPYLEKKIQNCRHLSDLCEVTWLCLLNFPGNRVPLFWCIRW